MSRHWEAGMSRWRVYRSLGLWMADGEEKESAWPYATFIMRRTYFYTWREAFDYAFNSASTSTQPNNTKYTQEHK